MKNTLKTIVNYVLIGVIGFLPIALVFQIVIYVERFLKDFVLLVHGRYENPLVTIALFAAAIAFLYYFGKLLKQDKAHLLYFLEAFIQRIPVIGTYLSRHSQTVEIIPDHRRVSSPRSRLCRISKRRDVGSCLCHESN